MNLRGDRESRAVGTKLTAGKKIGRESTAPQRKRAGLTAYVLSKREIDRLEPAQLHAERRRGKEKAAGGTGALGGSRGGGPASPLGCSSIEVHLLESLPLLAVRICFPLPPAIRSAPVRPLQVASLSAGDGFVDNFGIALLLFETPSGFAIFGFFALYLYRPDARESLWANFDMYERARHIVFLEEFQTFDDKSIAINVDTGVNSHLTEMIMKYYRPGHTLVVGNEEYKSIIESSLEIPCLYDGIVVELMWGMQHLMHRLVPGEKSELPKEDRVPMSEGLKMFLSGYGYNVKPEMVNEQIVSAASSLFHCNAVEKKEYPAFLRIGRLLKDLSGIDYKNWGALPLAAAFNIILTHKINDFDEIFFTQDVKLKLLKDADKYKGKVNEGACLMAYKTLVSAHKRKIQDKIELSTLVYEARGAHEALTKLSETHEK